MRKAVLLISGNDYKQQEMEIDTTLSEIESKYDFTSYPEIDSTFLINIHHIYIRFWSRDCSFKLDGSFIRLSKNSLQYGISMCPSMIRKLKVIIYFRKVFLLSKFKYFCFVAILDMSLISRSCKNDHIIFNVGTPSLEARNIRLVNIITYSIEEPKLISENMSPNVIHC